MQLLSKVNFIKLLFSIFCICSNAQEIRFTKLTVNGTIFTGNVLVLHQDHKGYIWLGTEDGLLKYDGKKLTYYKNDRYDTASLSDNYVTSIAEDSKGYLWIGTQGDLCRYDQVTDNFRRYDLNISAENRFAGNNIILIPSDSKGHMWIAVQDLFYKYDPVNEKFSKIKPPPDSDGNEAKYLGAAIENIDNEVWYGTSTGLFIFNPQTNKTRHIFFEKTPTFTLGYDLINFMHADSKKNVWLGTFGGLIFYNHSTKQFNKFKLNPDNPNYIATNQIHDIEIDSKGKIWVCTNYGLYICSPPDSNNQLHYKSFYNVDHNAESISSNATTSVMEDRDGRIWISSRFGGVDIYDPNRKNFTVFRHNTNDKTSLSYNNVSCFAEEKQGTIWISTDEGGLNRFDPVKNTFKHYVNEPGNTNSIANDKVLSLLIDNNTLWIGYWGGGLDKYDIQKNRFTHFHSDTMNKATLASDYIFYLMQDSRKNIWICHWGSGVTLLNPNTGKFTRYPKEYHNAGHLANNNVTVAYEDHYGTIWLGAENYGLFAYSYKTDSFIHYVNVPHDKNSLSHNSVTSLCEDKKGRLWIGTLGNGLNLLNRETGIFKSFTKNDGLADNAVCGILEDSLGNLWISTHVGITRFSYNPENKSQPVTIRNYYQNDGLQSNNFNLWAYFKSADGTMYFGGSNGFNHFKAELIQDNPRVPEIRLTGIYIFNEKYSKNIKAGKPIDELDQIELTHEESMLTIEFSALNYTDPQRNQYQCKLEGFDPEWRNNGNYNKAVYTNLDPGIYTFRVKASNNDGIWNEEGISLKIKVIPPYWKTWWYKTLIIIALVLIGIFIFRRRVNYLKRELEKQKEIETVLKMAKEKAEESDSLKSTILANLSHEVRTPLNGLLGFIELVFAPDLNENKRKRYIQIIKKRAGDLTQIIDSLLEISSLVAKSYQIRNVNVSPDDIIEKIEKRIKKKIAISAKDLIININIPDNTSKTIYTDPFKLETILWHITDNAIKFSDFRPIEIGYSCKTDVVVFYIKDQGIGISPEIEDIIFEPFRQSELGLARNYGGLGLGLTICKGLAELIHANIDYKTEVGRGTIFYITVPLNSSK